MSERDERERDLSRRARRDEAAATRASIPLTDADTLREVGRRKRESQKERERESTRQRAREEERKKEREKREEERGRERQREAERERESTHRSGGLRQITTAQQARMFYLRKLVYLMTDDSGKVSSYPDDSG